MSRKPKNRMPKKKKSGSAKHLATLEQRIEAQRRRAIRPTPPVNAQTRVSESLIERKRKIERKSRQRRDWEDL